MNREELILSVQPLVHRLAQDVHKRTAGLAELDDLIGDGYVGACKAADAFDPSRDLQFSTYASHRIRGCILDGLRERDVVHRRTNWDPTDPRLAPAARLDAPLGGDTDTLTLADVLPDLGESFDDILADYEAAHWALDHLGVDDRELIVGMYWHELTLDAIGQHLGVTESRVCQMHARAIHDMRLAFLRAGFQIERVNEAVARVARRKRGWLTSAEQGAVFGDLLTLWGDA